MSPKKVKNKGGGNTPTQKSAAKKDIQRMRKENVSTQKAKSQKSIIRCKLKQSVN